MKKIFTLLLFIISATSFSQVRISQVYGGGGNPGATYLRDFIEIYNAGTITIDIGNWSLQYASATGPVTPGDWAVTGIPAGNSILPGKYFLIALASGGTDGIALPTPDFLNNGINISNTAGKIALVNNATPLNGTTACSSASVIDVIGYGSGVSCAEGTALSTTGIDNTKSILRFSGGCTETNNNSSDFTLAAVNPRNSATVSAACLPGTPALTAGPEPFITSLAGTLSAEVNYLLAGFNLTGFPGNIAITASAGIEISLTSGAGFSTSLQVPFNAAQLPPVPVFVRLTGFLPAGVFTGSITHSVSGAPDLVMPVTGNILEAEPTIQTTNILLSNFTDNGMDISWTNGNGAARIVVIRQTATTTGGIPSDGTEYMANSNFSLAGTLGGGNKVIYSGTGSGPVTVSGLIPATNYTVTAFEYNGSAGSNNYYTFTNNPDTGTTTGTSSVLQQVNFAGNAPLYMGSGTSNRLPVMFAGDITGLLPNTVYRYYTQAAISSDFLTSSTGAGISILIDYTSFPLSFTYASTPSITAAGGYGKFVTNSSGQFFGAFGFVNTGNARFTPGNIIYPAIALAVDGSATISNRYALDSGIKVLQFATTSGPNDGTFIKGTSLTPAGLLVSLFDQDGSGGAPIGRPLYITLSENIPVITGNGATPWGSSFISGYDNSAGSWNAMIPNNDINGLRRIISADIRMGNVFCASDSDGIWPTGNVVTANASGGATTPLQISSTDAPLNNCFIIVPVKLSSFYVQKMKAEVDISWTTEQEINSSRFIVQRSTDGRTWKDILSVAAAGNSATAIKYAAKDLSPVKGINYYRLKQVDINRHFEYSETKTVLFSSSLEISLSPNPAHDHINLYLSKTGHEMATVILSDVNGKQLQKISSDDELIKISSNGIAAGIYFIQVISEGNLLTKKIIVQ